MHLQMAFYPASQVYPVFQVFRAFLVYNYLFCFSRASSLTLPTVVNVGLSRDLDSRSVASTLTGLPGIGSLVNTVLGLLGLTVKSESQDISPKDYAAVQDALNKAFGGSIPDLSASTNIGHAAFVNNGFRQQDVATSSTVTAYPTSYPYSSFSTFTTDSTSFGAQAAPTPAAGNPLAGVIPGLPDLPVPNPLSPTPNPPNSPAPNSPAAPIPNQPPSPPAAGAPRQNDAVVGPSASSSNSSTAATPTGANPDNQPPLLPAAVGPSDSSPSYNNTLTNSTSAGSPSATPAGGAF